MIDKRHPISQISQDQSIRADDDGEDDEDDEDDEDEVECEA